MEERQRTAVKLSILKELKNEIDVDMVYDDYNYSIPDEGTEIQFFLNSFVSVISRRFFKLNRQVMHIWVLRFKKIQKSVFKFKSIFLNFV